jgi:hypothetical protein
MDEAEYQRREQDLKFEIQIHDGLIGGLFCLEIAITVIFLISIGGGFSWYIALPLYVAFTSIILVSIRNCRRAINRYKQGLEDLIQPFG